MVSRGVDMFGASLSGLCLVHCLAPAAFLAIPFAGPALTDVIHLGHVHGIGAKAQMVSFSSVSDLFAEQAGACRHSCATRAHQFFFVSALVFAILTLALSKRLSLAVFGGFGLGLACLGFGLFLAPTSSAETAWTIAGAAIMATVHVANVLTIQIKGLRPD